MANPHDATRATPSTAQASGEDTVRIPAEDTGLDVVKTAALSKDEGFPGLVDPGDEIIYSLLVTNTSNAPARVAINDPMLAAAGVEVTCPDLELDPGENVTCTAAPFVVPADVEQGEGTTTLTNLVHATSTTEGGNAADGSDTATTPVAPLPAPGLTLGMGYTGIDTDGNGRLDVGEGVVFDYTVTNTGNVPLDDVTVVDERLTRSDIGVTCERTSLDPGQSTTCRADGPYAITAADMAAGKVITTATASGTARYTGLPSPPPDRADAVVPLLAAAPAPGPAPIDEPTPPGPTDEPSPTPTPTPTPVPPGPTPTPKPTPTPLRHRRASLARPHRMNGPGIVESPHPGHRTPRGRHGCRRRRGRRIPPTGTTSGHAIPGRRRRTATAAARARATRPVTGGCRVTATRAVVGAARGGAHAAMTRTGRPGRVTTRASAPPAASRVWRSGSAGIRRFTPARSAARLSRSPP